MVVAQDFGAGRCLGVEGPQRLHDEFHIEQFVAKGGVNGKGQLHHLVQAAFAVAEDLGGVDVPVDGVSAICEDVACSEHHGV